jgi:hypothetical protein
MQYFRLEKSMRVQLLLLSVCSSLATQIVGAQATESWAGSNSGMLDLLSDGYELKGVAGGPVSLVTPGGEVVGYSQYIYIFYKGVDTYRCQEVDEAGSLTVTGCYHLERK